MTETKTKTVKLDKADLDLLNMALGRMDAGLATSIKNTPPYAANLARLVDQRKQLKITAKKVLA